MSDENKNIHRVLPETSKTAKGRECCSWTVKSYPAILMPSQEPFVSA